MTVYCDADDCKWHEDGECQKVEEDGYLTLRSTFFKAAPAKCEDYETVEDDE